MNDHHGLDHLLDAEAAAAGVNDPHSARRALATKVARAVAGFALIGAGLAMLVLPGPGWVLIIVGLGLLPYRWARRLTTEIRRRVPGVPTEGRIPTRTLVAWGAAAAAIAATSILFGATITRWATESFGDPERLLGVLHP